MQPILRTPRAGPPAVVTDLPVCWLAPCILAGGDPPIPLHRRKHIIRLAPANDCLENIQPVRPGKAFAGASSKEIQSYKALHSVQRSSALKAAPVSPSTLVTLLRLLHAKHELDESWGTSDHIICIAHPERGSCYAE